MGYYDYFLRLGPDGGEPVLWLLLEYCALGSVLDVMEGQGAAMTEAQSALVLREVRQAWLRGLASAFFVTCPSGIRDFPVATPTHTHTHSHQALQVQTLSPQVLTALHYMHTDLRALHRDVKAANVLLTKAGKVKLGDLGVAAQVGGPTLTHRDNRKSR